MCECGLLATQRALDGILPALLGLFYLGRFASRLKGALHLPLLLHLVDVLPEAHSETSEIGSTQGGGFRNLRTDHVNTQQVGLILHQQVVAACTTIYLQLRERGVEVARHGLCDVIGLESNAVEGSTGDVSRRCATGDTRNSAAGVGIPVGRSQTRQSGHHRYRVR